jgi:hypothetical protein
MQIIGAYTNPVGLDTIFLVIRRPLGFRGGDCIFLGVSLVGGLVRRGLGTGFRA